MTAETRVDDVPAHAPAEQAGPPGSRDARDRSRWEGPLWLLAGLLVALALTWPLATQLSTHVPQDAADPLAEAWEVAWSGHALFTQPLRLYSANAFWPEGPSLAFSDSHLGYLPASLIGDGAVAVVVRYNLLFLFAYGLAFAGAGLLARELGARPAAAAVAAAAYAWAPWRILHNGHLNILSVGGVPLSLFLLVSGYRRGRPWQVVAGWLVAAWQVSIGFALGIWFVYLLGLLTVVAGVVWLRRGRPALPRPLVRASAFGGGAFLVLVGLLLTPYLAVRSRYPDAGRSLADVDLYSPPVRGLFAAAGESRAWGERTAFVRDTLGWAPEMALFPGLLVVVLAAVGLRHAGVDRRLRTGLAAIGAVALVLGFGTAWAVSKPLYVLLFELAPGWSSLRTPGRLAFVWTLVLALLAAFGTERLLRGLSGTARSRLPAAGASAVAVLLAGVVLYEGSPRLPLAEVPKPPAGLAAVPGPLVHFPASAGADNTYMYWSTESWTKIANGNTSYLPPSLAQVRGMETFPDAITVGDLRARGYESVVVHLDRIGGTPWEPVPARPVDGLGVSVRTEGTMLVFDLNP